MPDKKAMQLLSTPFRLMLLLAGMVIAVQAHAKDDDALDDGMWTGDFEYVEKNQWRETNVAVPAIPKNKNLLFFKVYNSPFKHYIDGESLFLETGDNIARYTVVLESSSGVRNIRFEGIRCDTHEYKTYAYSLNGAPFQILRSQTWQPLSSVGTSAYRTNLFNDFLCESSNVRGKKREIIHLFIESPDHYSFEPYD